MSKRDVRELTPFLRVFPLDVRRRALWLRNFVWDLYPGANELIYDNYNALAFGWSPTDRVGHTFCNVAVGRASHNVHLGFYWGAELADPRRLLRGEGNQYRYLLVDDLAAFPKSYMKTMLEAAHANSVRKVKDHSQFMQGATIVKSISGKKRAAGKNTLQKAKAAPVAVGASTRGKAPRSGR